MSNMEKVIIKTRRLESLLRSQYHADGKGMHELITSCEERLPHDVIKKLRFIATIRNKMVHEDGFELEDSKQFFATCLDCEKELTPRSGRFIWGVAISLMVLLTLAAASFYYIHWQDIKIKW